MQTRNLCSPVGSAKAERGWVWRSVTGWEVWMKKMEDENGMSMCSPRREPSFGSIPYCVDVRTPSIADWSVRPEKTTLIGQARVECIADWSIWVECITDFSMQLNSYTLFLHSPIVDLNPFRTSCTKNSYQRCTDLSCKGLSWHWMDGWMDQ